MPLSRCPTCGFSCRALWVQSKPLKCPECDAPMENIGRAALDSKAKPRLLARARRNSPPAPRLTGR